MNVHLLTQRYAAGKEVIVMEQAQALAIVRSLSDGVDPESGEVFPPESAYQRPQVVRPVKRYAVLERQALTGKYFPGNCLELNIVKMELFR